MKAPATRSISAPVMGAVALVTAVVTASCASDEPAAVAFPGVEPFGATLPGVPADGALSFGSVPVCTPTGEPLDIAAVEPEGDVVVTSFAARPLDGAMLGAEDVPLDHAGFDTARRTVTASCAEGEADELGLELSRPAASGTVGAESFQVTTRSGGTTLPFAVTLCDPADTDTPGCDPDAE
ncbi:hypothetical protein [Isoptericola sediminis]|uniref:Lipoprotein n=1 Tax=Isoptericola sediminis TaxID=2733572 RepID=A0A849JVL0_9MICO|nr:hypothetical protein [Isoptericola sediminis]NNU27376.1 hypothetical protein [Isoptericola sediminis]